MIVVEDRIESSAPPDVVGDALALVAATSDLGTALPALNRILSHSLGVAVTDVVVADRAWRAAVGAAAPEPFEVTVISAWRTAGGNGPAAISWDGGILVPVAVGRRVLGLARVRATADSHGRVALDAREVASIGDACAAIVRSAYLSWEITAARQRLDDAGEQEDASSAVRLVVDSLLDDLDARLGAVSHAAAERDWQSRLDELASVVLRGRHTIRRLSCLPELLGARRKRGLVPALRELTRRFGELSGTPADLEVRGERTALGAARDRALFRVACDTLVCVDGVARASVVVVVLAFEARTVRLSVCDDGTGLVHRSPFAAAPGLPTLAGLRRRVEPLGGSLSVRNLRPHGVLVECELPLD